ncbi:MAG: penicillin-insensitive murein endopeptidase [Deltaproteobacteria bacterium]|nr:penicillin-insensitive murein endopeptidase [Deltaproteobacteria bacterium]MCB9788054.1 penicillin-insensitive murein endopeptidase [Deltaproteobacteria bacterium]
MASLALGAWGCEASAPARGLGELAAHGLRPLELGSAALLPAAGVAEPPRAPSAPAAFDHAEDSRLGSSRSYSLGTTSRGRLVGGRPLPDQSAALVPRAISVARGAIYGTDELVGALERAAAHVAERWPGSVLYAGDLSARRGGDIAGHVSHNSGRDADLAFYLRDAAGRIADRDDLPAVRADGSTSTGELHFDDARNFELIASLVRDPRIQVQWIFVSAPLRERLLRAGAGAGADPALLERVAAVLAQPRDSSPHVEHFHLRLYCALEERVEGCLDAGRVHPWVDTFEAALQQRVAEVVPLLHTGAAEEARYAITRLVRLRARDAADDIAALTQSDDPETQALATDAVAFLRGQRTPPAWAHLLPEDAGE